MPFEGQCLGYLVECISCFTLTQIHVRRANLVRIMLLVRTIMATTDAPASLVTKERFVNKVTVIPLLIGIWVMLAFMLVG